MKKYFTYDPRLKIKIPNLHKEWDMYTSNIQNHILVEWETIRGHIPDRIAELENEINLKQEQLEQEEDFLHSCILNEEISSLASIINDLWIWFRTTQHISRNKLHS